MKQVVKTSLIVVALLVFAVGSAEAGGKKRGKGMHENRRGDRVEKAIKHLDLSEEQIETLKKIREEMKEDMTPLVEKERDLKRKMRAEWRSDTPSEDKLISLQRKLNKVKGKIGELRIEHRIDMGKTLTKEQRQKLKKIRMSKKNKFDKRRGDKMDKRRGAKLDRKNKRFAEKGKRHDRKGAKGPRYPIL